MGIIIINGWNRPAILFHSAVGGSPAILLRSRTSGACGNTTVDESARPPVGRWPLAPSRRFHMHALADATKGAMGIFRTGGSGKA